MRKSIRRSGGRFVFLGLESGLDSQRRSSPPRPRWRTRQHAIAAELTKRPWCCSIWESINLRLDVRVRSGRLLILPMRRL